MYQSYAKGSLPQKLRNAIFLRDGWRCFYCAIPCDTDGNTVTGASVDHLTPECRGGSHEESNLVTACRRCNTRKRQMTLEEYRQFLMRRQCGIGEAADLLSQALDTLTIATPHTENIVDAIEWLNAQIVRVVFPGE